MPRKKRDKSISEWKETSLAADELGISIDTLMRLRASTFKAGKHYRVKNPTAGPKGRRYLWNVPAIALLLTPPVVVPATVAGHGKDETKIQTTLLN
jgi:hypothetical protein